ncbi:MAG: HAMP domain-containing histidine kinase [Crocinitomicaceae bacterium]|nr:HAMP domain-containing histidine kinase [Crocinitomicaceae bacterium]
MKLLNKSLFYLSLSLLIIIGIWSLVFYFNILREIKESIDEGLDNYRRQIIHQAQNDTTLLEKDNFNGGFFSLREISQEQALSSKDRYIDTVLYMQDADDDAPELEPFRLLTTAFEDNGNYYELQIVNSMVEEDDLIGDLFREVIWLYLLLIATILIINKLVLQGLWKPFYSFLDQLKNYRIGTGENFPDTGTKTKEFADLQNAVTILLQHNIETYERQKQFIENASHELQTPLAIATNKLELFIEKGNLLNEQAESIADVMRIIERLVHLNKTLLLLTKIENKQFLDSETVSFNEIINQCVRDMEEISEFKKIEISVSEESELTTKMDISLANIIVSNLLRNAIYHNISGGFVKVEISENIILVSNTGDTIPLNEQNVFSRFSKSASNGSGTGLGLSIVKAICDLYGFSVSYRFENGLHCFRVFVK